MPGAWRDRAIRRPSGFSNIPGAPRPAAFGNSDRHRPHRTGHAPDTASTRAGPLLSVARGFRWRRSPGRVRARPSPMPRPSSSTPAPPRPSCTSAAAGPPDAGAGEAPPACRRRPRRTTEVARARHREAGPTGTGESALVAAPRVL